MAEKISPDEFIRKMREIKEELYFKKAYIEECHMEMDELMCKTLSSLGYDEGVKLFRTTPKWYA